MKTIAEIIGIVVVWFIAGGVVNFFFYGLLGLPSESSSTAKFLHIALNIIAVILIFKTFI
jgi:hypothetical protein